MTVIKTPVHYAHSAHGQPNNNHPSASERSNWTNSANASAANVTKAPNGSMYAQYMNQSVTIPIPGTKKKKTVTYKKIPWTSTGLEFQFEIPNCAYIRNIKFEVPIRHDGSATIPAPHARFNFYHGTKSIKNNIKNHNGWYDGYYYQASNKSTISSKFTTHVFEMSGTEFRKRGYPVSECNESRFGIDLRWAEPTKMKSSVVNVFVKYFKCTIEYEMPDEIVTFERVTTGDDPQFVDCGKWYPVEMTYQNRSNAGCCSGVAKGLKVDIPPNAQIMQYPSSFNKETMVWNVQCKPNDKETIVLWLKDYSIGLGQIKVQDVPNNKSWNYWVYSVPQSIDVGEVTGYTGIMQKDVRSCVTFESIMNASGAADFYVSLVNSREVGTVLPSPDEVEWVLDREKSSQGVSLANVESSDPNNFHLRFNVPEHEQVNIVFSGCFLPRFTGMAFATCEIDDTSCDVDYNVIEPPIYIVRNNPITDESDRTVSEITLRQSVIKFKTHRVATSTEIGAYVIDCGIADLDGTMVDDDCTLSANVWEKLDYIGCVPLWYHHYDPESTYTNKGISESYKNKTYKGKEGVIDEKITLKFKARPKQVPTLQGLVKLDKPTPINANWRCFEGDPLNHRGWAVLSEIKCTRTNPLWYDCEAEVDYITHDINTKFQIFKELQVNTQKMPEIMAETFDLGENLSTALDIFNIDTDGGFIYDDDNEGAKNLFSLDEGQHLLIATRNQLSDVSHIRFDWYSTKIDEHRENTMERVFRVKDANGDSVLEYEYSNIQFFDDYITTDVLVRVKTEGESWKTQIYNDVDLKTEIEIDPIAYDGDDDTDEEIVIIEDDTIYYYYDEDLDEYIEITETDYDGDKYTYDEDTQTYVLVEADEEGDDVPAYEPDYIAPEFDPSEYVINTIYGSSLELTLNGNKISIYEAGYNGRELALENIELIKSNSYTFETYWENHNVDGNTEDVLSYIDVELAETILDTANAQYYSNLRVSPFPIPYKTVVFTRESEEGTIYYLTGEEPFKYRIEPYYQYHCGCDLVTREGVSIFDLNNSYTYFYIENGLIRLGFNKFNGRLYLAKWDIVSKDWITTHYFHMSDDIKFSLESYSDDKIVIKAGNDTFFTIWRGHPFIGIKNPNDSIFIDTNFSYGLSDKINGQGYDYPIVYSFMNTNNLLPECIGGTKIDYDCMAIDDDDITTGTDHTLTIAEPQTSIIAGEDTIFDVTLDPYTTDGSVHYLVDNVDMGTVEAPFDWTTKFNEPKEYTIQAVYVGDDDDNVAISNKIVVKVNPPAARDGSDVDTNPQGQVPGEYNLRIVSAPKKFTYLDDEKVVLELRKGTTLLEGYPIELQLPSGVTRTDETVKGRVSIQNKSYEVGKYQWGGRFYDSRDDDQNRKLLLKALRYIDIEKATPKFTYNATDGRLNKGKYLHINLHGVKTTLHNQTVTYTINGGSKKSKKTNDKGKIYIKFDKKDTYKIKVMYAGNKNYKSISKTFTLKVV